MDRASLDRGLDQKSGPYRIIDRLTGAEVELKEEDYNDLCRVHLYDFLEQIGRLQEWAYRSGPYRRMAERLGTKAIEAYDRGFAQELEAGTK